MARSRHRQKVAGVYFVQGVATRLIKVGHSSDVGVRFQSLRAGSPDVLVLLGILPGAAPEEAAIHARFGHMCKHFEWFTPSPELLTLAVSGSDLAATVVGTVGRWNAAHIAHARKMHEEPISPFAARVRAWRAEAKLSEAEASRVLSARGGAVRTWEQGNGCPTADVVPHLAAAWGITTAELLAIPGATTDVRKKLWDAMWWRKYGAPQAAAYAARKAATQEAQA